MEKLLDSEVRNSINENKIKIEPYGDLVDAALSNLRSHAINNQDSYAQQENDEVEGSIQTTNELYLNILMTSLLYLTNRGVQVICCLLFHL